MECSLAHFSDSALQLVAFDLDGTLTASKQAITPVMVQALEKLLSRYELAIISGGLLAQFQAQVLDQLTLQAQSRTLHLLPTCGTRYYRVEWVGGQIDLVPVYQHLLDTELRNHTKTVMEQCARELGLWEKDPWGEIIEDRGTQVTFSALGQYAPLEAKRLWDPDGTKKTALVVALSTRLPQLEARSGGSTSVDVTARGIDKAYGLKELMRETGYRAENLLFIGDQLGPQGNDFPVLSTGVRCESVSSTRETLALITDLISGN